ncbi:transferrin 3 isoform X2 [Lycorma delicatula]|uniref:transferrin 3 isoform X2 n=1 Tax=Lycorma delicatula TaxID=130591 RepID=UPI003F510BDE
MWIYCTMVLLYLMAVLFFNKACGDVASVSFKELTDNKFKPYRVCVSEKKINIEPIEQCSLFEKVNAPVRCVVGRDRLDCLRKISMQKADFTVFHAEELLVASSHKNLNNIVITAEFQRSYSTISKFQYGLVVVVRNDVNINSLQDLEAKRLCHPGTDPDGQDHSDIFSQYIEDRLVVQKCDPNRTIAENRVKSLADYFDESCKAGPWSLDPLVDSSLKKKYGSLCNLCDDPYRCSIKDKYWGRSNALLCLSDCQGDFSWGRYQDVRRHFKKQLSYSNYQQCNNVSLLCPDGTKQDLMTSDPCIWIQKPNTVIAAHSTVARNVQNIITNVLINQTDGDDYRNALSGLLESSPTYSTVDLISPSDYLKQAEGFLSSTSSTRCGKDREIKLCATSDHEKAQCQWLSAAAASYGIEPPLSCYEPPDNNCFTAVEHRFADVFLTNSDQLLPAMRDHSLQPLLYETVYDVTHYKYFGVIFDSRSNINKLEDLRGKNACFTAIDGVGWTTLVMALKKSSLLMDSCPYHETVSNFFHSICITNPKVDPNIINKYKNIKYCNNELAEDYNKQSDVEIEAVDCLISGGGDVAFVSIDSVLKYIDLMVIGSAKDLVKSRYKWLCDGNKIKNVPCFWTWTTMGQVLVHKDINYIQKEDIISTFKGLDALFGDNNKNIRQTFNIFAEFESLEEIFQNVPEDWFSFCLMVDLKPASNH